MHAASFRPENTLLRYRQRYSHDKDAKLVLSRDPARRVLALNSNTYTPQAHASCLTRCLFHFLFRPKQEVLQRHRHLAAAPD